MAKIQGIAKLNKTISKQLKPFGITKARLSTDYAYYFNSGKVDYKITDGTIEDRLFNQFVLEKFDYEIEDNFIFSLLHEVGHHKTFEDLTDEEWSYCSQEKDRIEKEMRDAHTRYAVKKLEYEYFNLIDEMLATSWAVEYAKANPRKVVKMKKKSHRALKRFYKKNGVV